MPRSREPRRSAKAVIEQYTRELLKRQGDVGVSDKLLAIEIIAFRMGWNDLYERIRFRAPIDGSNIEYRDEEKTEPKEPWWNK